MCSYAYIKHDKDLFPFYIKKIQYLKSLTHTFFVHGHFFGWTDRHGAEKNRVLSDEQGPKKQIVIYNGFL